jgi:uncharacterized protein (TIGR02271 family)
MTTRTVTAMFNSRAEAERATQALVSDLSVDRSMVRTNPEAGSTDTGYDKSRPYEETGFFASLKSLFVPDDDRYAYAEGMRRGNVLVSATVDENQVDRAADILEHAGAVDLDQQEATWRQGGWSGYDSSMHNSTSRTATGAAAGALGGAAASVQNAASRAANAVTGRTEAGRTDEAGRSDMGRTDRQAAGTAGRDDETLKVVEERLVVGKREVDRGRVRVRSYVVERPVEEQVSLHEERVQVERHKVDRALTDADRDVFKERVIEATAHSEEAVVGKETRIVEEIDIHKDVSDRTETVRDTVRRTEVEVDDGSNRMAGATATGNTAGRAADKSLGTNVSGTNPGANAPDGTPGNPSGTMASRAVDKTLGTNISGANPTRKP